jgi:putative tryptophan/tyrosine transport system substrate-binding protein
MRRREFIAGLGGVVACPSGARPQQADRVQRVGWLDIVAETDPAALRRVLVFRGGLEKLGWAIGRNLAIDYRWGAVDIEHARSDAAELLRLAPDVIICAGTPAALALQQLTRTVPIVFALVSEPVAQGIVQSLAHPGANITGFSYLEPTLGGKWLNLLKEIAPGINHVALMFNPASSPYSRLFYQSIREATAQLSVKAVLAAVYAPTEIEELIKMLAGEPGGGLIVSADAFNLANRELIIQLAARHQLPAIYGIPGTAADGGLIYYGGDIDDSFREAVNYVDRILRGANPADLPVQQPRKFAMTINLKTAKALGLTVPLTLHVAADEVFE